MQQKGIKKIHVIIILRIQRFYRTQSIQTHFPSTYKVKTRRLTHLSWVGGIADVVAKDPRHGRAEENAAHRFSRVRRTLQRADLFARNLN